MPCSVYPMSKSKKLIFELGIPRRKMLTKEIEYGKVHSVCSMLITGHRLRLKFAAVIIEQIE